MKKNKLMRVASVLMVLTLLSTCAISGTFAKYVTAAEASDSARVAKWGIQFDNANVATFATAYDADTNATVKNGTEDGANLVAPGTSDSGTFKMTGAPETAYQVSFAFDANTTKEVYLKSGTYTYDSTKGYASTMNATADDFTGEGAWLKESTYYPIVYTVTLDIPASGATINGNQFTDGAAKEFRTLKDAITAIEATTVDYVANTECATTLTIAWKWAFESQSDKLDTILGDVAAANNNAFVTNGIPTGEKVSTEIAYKLTMTATQVD